MTPVALTVNEACFQLSISRSMIYELIKAGKLPIYKIGRRTLIFYEDLLKLAVPVIVDKTETRPIDAKSTMVQYLKLIRSEVVRGIMSEYIDNKKAEELIKATICLEDWANNQ